MAASPSLLGKAGDSSAAGHRSLRGELQPLGMQCRETHAFLFSFPKNQVAPFAFPSLSLLKAALWFLAEVSPPGWKGFLRQVAGQVAESRLPPWGIPGSSGWQGLAHPAAVRFSSVGQLVYWESHFLLYHLSASVTCVWGWGGAHLVAAALPCCVRCPSHSARGIEHLCYSNY